MRVIRFSGCEVRILDEMQYLETVFPDGSVVRASPEDTDEYRATAERLGYGADTWRMCIEHEILHTALAEAMGLNYSPALRCVALGLSEDHWREEDRVLEVQRRLNEIHFMNIWSRLKEIEERIDGRERFLTDTMRDSASLISAQLKGIRAQMNDISERLDALEVFLQVEKRENAAPKYTYTKKGERT